MQNGELFDALDSIIDAAQVGVLATVDGEARPAMRWMTPTQIRGRRGFLYAVTSPGFRKIRQLENNPNVEWMFQTPDLNRIVTVRGVASIVDNPQLKSEVLEAIGRRLEVFWRVNRNQEFVVLETRIDEIRLFRPMTQRRYGARIGKDRQDG